MADQTGTMPIGEMSNPDEDRVGSDTATFQIAGFGSLPMPGETETVMLPGLAQPMPGADETEGVMDFTALPPVAQLRAMPGGDMTGSDQRQTIALPGTWKVTLTRVSP
jgi:hypothetical protein